MNTRVIDGKCFAQMLLGGAAVLANHTEDLNALNVFPVADGDTGTNMLRTIEGGLAEARKTEEESISSVSGQFARGVLLGARGNSGVILSQIFAGINDGLKPYETVTASELAEAYRNGIARSYAAVQTPTEGTILTVFRESTEYALSHITEESSVEEFYRLHIEEARRSLASTKERLPVLAEADVVDSGAAGYLCIAEGMYEALSGNVLSYEPQHPKESSAVNIDLFTRDSTLEFGYCTEFLLRLTTAKVDPDTFDIQRIVSALKELGGESIVAYKQDDIVKVHVHTRQPGLVMTQAQEFGEFLTVKIENMSLGHSDASETRKPEKRAKSSKKYSVITVATGEGLSALFEQMGADRVISGGQTSNPSTEEFLEAFRSCDTENIIVLPNNKNIFLAAKQAAELYSDAKVHIVETKNLAQGYSALSVITPGITDIEVLTAGAQRAALGVIDGEITRAVRDASIEGISIKAGDYIAISGGKIVATAPDAESAVLSMLRSTDTDLSEIITLFVGKTVSPAKRAELTAQLQEEFADQEIVVYEGGQEVYDYFLAIE